MKLRGFKTIVVGMLAAAGCVLALLSCGRSATAPSAASGQHAGSGQLLVSVSVNGVTPAAGKKIEIEGTSLSQTTDMNGQTLFTVHAGSYVVRAYDIGTPGPSREYVEKSVVVEAAHTSRAQFNDCTMCR